VPIHRATTWILPVLFTLAVATARGQGTLAPQPLPAEPEMKTWTTRWHEFWHTFDVHRQRIAAWPEPFLIPDRDAVRYPLQLMVDNGWKQQNTFDDPMFTDANELSVAGLAKLRWLLVEVPPHRRQIFVLEAATPQQTSGRLASLYAKLAELAPDCPPVSVYTTRIPPRTASGAYLDAVDRACLAAPVSMALPVAPAASNSAGNVPASGTAGATAPP
jgi:hypothetical protein